MSNETKRDFTTALPSMARDIKRATSGSNWNTSYDNYGDYYYDRDKVDHYMSTGRRRGRRW